MTSPCHTPGPGIIRETSYKGLYRIQRSYNNSPPHQSLLAHMSLGPSSEVSDFSYVDVESFEDVEDPATAQGQTQTEDHIASSGVPDTPQPDVQYEHTHSADIASLSDDVMRHDTYYFNTDMIGFLVRLSHVRYSSLFIIVPRSKACTTGCTSTYFYAIRLTGGNS